MEAQRCAQKGASPDLHPSPSSDSSSRMSSPLDAAIESSEEDVQSMDNSKSLRRPQGVVTIFVGLKGAKEPFFIHKDVICFSSAFFFNAFYGKHLEGLTQTMSLDDVDLELFGFLVEWLYTQAIDVDLNGRKGLNSNMMFLARLWTLASRFAMLKFQNTIMDRLLPLVERSEGTGLKSFLYYAYGSSSEKTMLKTLAADKMAWTTSAEGLDAWMSGGLLPDCLLVDIIMSLKKDRGEGVDAAMKFSTPGEYYMEVGVKVEELVGEAVVPNQGE